MKISQRLMDDLLGYVPKYRYGEVRAALHQLGWWDEPMEAKPQGRCVKATIFRHPRTHLFILIQRMRSNSFVKPIDMLSIRNTLKNTGLYKTGR